MSEYKIDRDVPLPLPHRGRKSSPLKAALLAMKAGDSMFIPDVKRNTLEAYAYRVIGAGSYAVRAEGKGHRLWRVK